MVPVRELWSFLWDFPIWSILQKGLIKGGKSPDTPAAVIEDGSLASQRTVRGTLETIYEKSLKAGLKTPAIIVVGETAAFDLRSEEMTGDKIDDKPLSGLQSGSPVPLLLQPV